MLVLVKFQPWLISLLSCAEAALLTQGANVERTHTSYGLTNSSDSQFFPLAVWLQNTVNAEKYRKAGINTYVGLWKGPTEQQLADLKKAGMQLICSQNDVGLKHKDDPSIVGWMHGDEPDNAQAERGG